MASTGVVEPAEQYLEYLRMLGRSPNTVKSYARALALWWEFLTVYELAWDAVTVEDLGRFLGWLRTGDSPALVSIERRPARFSEGTVALRLQAVCSFYRYHHFNGVEAASRLYERVFSGRHAYKPMLEHLARRRGHERRVVRVVAAAAGDAADADARAGRADPRRVRAVGSGARASGMGRCATGCCGRFWPSRGCGSARRSRSSTAIGTPASGTRRSSRWCRARITRTGCGSRTAATGKIYVSDELDRLYGEYLWRLCDAGADEAVGDLDSWWVFVNLAREPRFAAAAGGDGRVAGPPAAPPVRRPSCRPAFTPHWLRHTHATALLMSGIAEHVVSRRLGHLGHPDDAEPLRLGVRGRRAAHGRAVAGS